MDLPGITPETPAPEAPVAPIAPATPEAPAPEVDKDQEEWDEVSNEVLPDKKQAPAEDKKDEVTPVDPVAPVEVKKDEVTPETPAETPVPEAPVSFSSQQEEYESVKNDVREKLLKETPLELKDADGDVIKGVEDLVKLVNPATGEAFTEQEASLYLVQAKQDLQEKKAQMEEYAHQIALTNVKIKTDSENVMKKFGDILKQNPELAQGLWEQYSRTLVMHEDMVVKAPVSLADFYTTALTPYQKMSEVQAEAEAAKKAAEEVQRKQTQVDRSDIHSSGKIDTSTEEEKEWDDVAKDFYK
jgi:hypothetical protein